MSIFEHSPRKWPMTHLKNTHVPAPPPPSYHSPLSETTLKNKFKKQVVQKTSCTKNASASKLVKAARTHSDSL